MFIEKRILIWWGILWILTILTSIFSYSLGSMNGTLNCIRDNIETLEELFNEIEQEPKVEAKLLSPIDMVTLEVKKAADRYPRLSFHLLMGVIEVESGGDPSIVSRSGAIGLMQIMPTTGEEIAQHLGEEWTGPETLYDVATNIRYGSYYLNWLVNHFEGNEQAAIAAYNWGPTHISRRLANGATLPRVYPGKVLAAAERGRL